MSREACIELAKRLGLDGGDVTERWVERAAIREYDGEQLRAAAERGAFEDVRAELER